jgi:hypothetical protein
MTIRRQASPSHAGEHAPEARTEARRRQAALPVMDYLAARAGQ